MPTYEYQCLDCDRKVEYFQSIHEPPVTECPSCHGKMSRLVSSGTGLIFKGSGFYITDYKKSNSAPTSTPNEKSPASDESKPETKPVEPKGVTENK